MFCSFAVTRDGLFSTLWVRCDDWIVLNLDAFCARLGDLDEANFDGKLNHMYVPIFSPPPAPPAGPPHQPGWAAWGSRIERLASLAARCASGLAALAAVRLRRTNSEIDR